MSLSVYSPDGGAVGGHEEDISIPLPGITDSHSFENWTKCVMGMNITRKSLRKQIEIFAKKNLKEMDEKEIYHFKTFIKCLEDQKIFHLTGSPKSHNKKLIWNCGHDLCWKILNYLINFHVKKNKLKWERDNPTTSTPKEEEEEKDVDVIIDNYFWDIMKLYTYNETVEGKADSEKIDKIELILLLQILNNCEFSQFTQFQERHEDKMRKARNEVMHSGDMSLSDESRQKFFQRLSKTLRIFRELRACKEAIYSLRNLETHQLFKLATKEDELTVVIGKALKSRKDALTFDMRTCIDIEEKKNLNSILASTCNQIKEFSVTEVSKKTQELQKKSEADATQLWSLQRKVESLERELQDERRRNMGAFQSVGRAVDRSFWFWQ